ncbi:RNase P/MRP, p29 subunit [Dichomitus squalens]|uniref:RNase P/MRP, p29 subunit n=1 Tax=Dichomitus squalens TaxID=114155 RepID=A0A4Q9MWL6_9APHY|nr:RNase P/MRP, p29 subunit [Dichomitus squalens]
MKYRAADNGHRGIYAPLPLISNERLKLDTTTPFIPHYVKSSVTRSSDPAQAYASRVQGRQILLENPARGSKAKKEREEKRAKRTAERVRRVAGVISMQEGRKRGIWKLRKEERKFQLFLPLHFLWLGYMNELLSLSPEPAALGMDPSSAMPAAAGMHAKLIKADFHGAIVTVRQSRNPCLVGLSGIVVHETENSFKVITRKDEQKLLPKQNSIFVFAVPLYSTATPQVVRSTDDTQTTILDMPHIEFELYGNHFCYRAAERAGRKFKHKETIEL